MDELYLLNGGFNRWATDPNGPHRLLLPVRAVDRFKHNLATLSPEKHLRWNTHTVARGQSLASIAKRYRTNAAALREANDLQTSRLQTGLELKVPWMPGAQLAKMRGSDIYQARKAAVGRNNARKRTHVVKSGESLWRVARRYGVTATMLAAWNGISRNSTIHPGQKLLVWGKASRGHASIAGGKRSHTVRKGDTLSGIAHAYQVSSQRLAARNGITTKTILRVGKKLVLPSTSANETKRVDAANKTVQSKKQNQKTEHAKNTSRRVTYTVKRGDSLWGISRKFKVSVASLREWNKLKSSGALYPGQTLALYVTSTGKT